MNRYALLCLLPLVLSACALPPTSPEAAALRQEQEKALPEPDIKLNNRTPSASPSRVLPDRPAEADVSLDSAQTPDAVVQCLKQQLQNRFRLPDDFLQIRSYANNVQTVALHNPFTHKDGVLMDIHPRGVGSATVRLYANGTTLSRAWRNLPNACK